MGKLLIPQRLVRAGSPGAFRSAAAYGPVPDHRALSPPPGIEAKPLGCSCTAPEKVHGAVRAPLLDGQGGLVPKTRALSHYSGEPLEWFREPGALRFRLSLFLCARNVSFGGRIAVQLEVSRWFRGAPPLDEIGAQEGELNQR